MKWAGDKEGTHEVGWGQEGTHEVGLGTRKGLMK